MAHRVLFRARGAMVLQLDDGSQTIVDDSDEPVRLTTGVDCTTNPSGYVVCRIPDSEYSAFLHRLVRKTPVALDVDHINRVPYDNRSGNLRSVTKKVNRMNQRPSSTCRSNVAGLRRRKNGWSVRWKAPGCTEFSSAVFNDSDFGGDLAASRKTAMDFLEEEKRKDADYVEATQCKWPDPCLIKMDVRYLCNDPRPQAGEPPVFEPTAPVVEQLTTAPPAAESGISL